MKSKKTNTEEFANGHFTGYNKGYAKGIEDAVVIIQSILQHNDIRMDAKEFYLEMENLRAEGVLTRHGDN